MIHKFTWKHISAADYFSKINIPNDWDTLEDFVDWFLDARMPMMIPWNAEVIRSDDAVAICLFRKGNYQVELYLEYPQMHILRHCHPNMEVITMDLGGGKMTPKEAFDTSAIWGSIAKKLPPGEYHGGDTSTDLGNGFVTLAFQRWEYAEEITSAAIQWKGELQGPIQENLIRIHKKNVKLIPGYADVSKPSDK